MSEEILKQIILNIKYLKTKQINEENTKSILIEPLLLLLGWNIYNINEVEREYSTSGKGFVDYKLKKNEREFYLEAKSLGTNLSKHDIQITTYSYNDNIPFCILTDGNEYRFFETFNFEKKCIFIFKLNDLTPQQSIEIFNSLFIKNVNINNRYNHINDHLYNKIKKNILELNNKYKIKHKPNLIEIFYEFCVRAINFDKGDEFCSNK